MARSCCIRWIFKHTISGVP